jgi:DNA-binding transcriptional ArsR family regulator
LAVLSDPTRKALVDALRKGPLTVGALAEGVPVSRSAVSQHLQVLKAAELVEDEVDGTRRLYRLRPTVLGELREYVDGLWSDALAGFASDISVPIKVTKRRRA